MLTFLQMLADDCDQAKVEEIYTKYHNIMYKVALKKLAGKPNASYLAEDVIQNAFVKIIKSFHAIRFDEGEEKLKAYFTTIASNEAANILKKQKDVVYMDDLTEEPYSDEDFVDRLCLHSEYERVKQAIMELDDQYRTVLLMKYAEEKSVREISEILDMKEPTVYTNLRRGREALLRMLGKDGLV